jgi:uncharacterized protein
LTISSCTCGKMALKRWEGLVPSTGGVEVDAIVVGRPDGRTSPDMPVFVMVHPFGKMGGCRDLMIGNAVRMALRWGAVSVVFDLRGVGSSTGWATFTQHAEVDDVRSVVKWIRRHGGPSPPSDDEPVDTAALGVFQSLRCKRDEAGLPTVCLFGSSAGGPTAGSAMDEPGVICGVFTGYVFGWWASWLFGGHYSAIKATPLPKLFIQGTSDGFTSCDQLRAVAKECAGPAELCFVDGVGHFELEGPEWDERVADVSAEYVLGITGGKVLDEEEEYVDSGERACGEDGEDMSDDVDDSEALSE